VQGARHQQDDALAQAERRARIGKLGQQAQ
jgi:hypothetical protein